ncbi:MAG: CpsD/CapB family tyrosine-protein kinase [Terriglobales bacterium]
MVIERALEKLRQAAATKAAAERGTLREPTKHVSSATQPAIEPRPTFPQLQCDPAAAVAHRTLQAEASSPATGRAAAAYRMVRTRLLNATRTNKIRSIAITSPGPGDGKSVTAINLALSLARDPATSVFLLDLDMRKPSICGYLGVHPPVELLSYFTGSSQAPEVFFSVGPPNLAIAGGLASTEGASELVGSGRFEALLAYIVSICSNPIILIDLPPLLVTDEALLLAPRVDATLLVVAEGRTRRDSLVRAVTMLADFTCVGVVLNRSSEALEGDSYYYGYK